MRVLSVRQRVGGGLLTMLAALGCDETGPTAPMPRRLDQNAAPGCSSLVGSNRVVIDASRDGGVWWFPQVGSYSPEAPHQGRALAEYFRARGFVVDELGRGTRLTEEVFLGAKVVIRASAWGQYSAAELEAYRKYLACPTTLVLLSEPSSHDQLAQTLGLQFSGVVSGTITDFAHHPLTDGVTALPIIGGTTLSAGYPGTVRILARFGGLPVMGLLEGRPARILFVGDLNGLETVPQPFVDNLIAWGF